MSLYNAVFGFNPACILLLPMIGKTPDDFPWFRDCFVGEPWSKTIHVLTRTGGGNRELYEVENDAITLFEGYVKDWDDDFDSTFAYWEIAAPEKWHADYDKIVMGNFSDLSQEYIGVMKAAYPELSGEIDKLTGENDELARGIE